MAHVHEQLLDGYVELRLRTQRAQAPIELGVDELVDANELSRARRNGQYCCHLGRHAHLQCQYRYIVRLLSACRMLGHSTTNNLDEPARVQQIVFPCKFFQPALAEKLARNTHGFCHAISIE